jgi:hypothetical protein
MRIRRSSAARAIATALAVFTPVVAADTAHAQRRPGVGMGFYTYSALPTLDAEAGSVTSTTGFTESPRFAFSAMASIGLLKGRGKAWIVGVRGTALSLPIEDRCVVTAGTQGCQSRRYLERVALHTGAAVDIRSTLLRVTAGPALYTIEGGETRIGPQVRIDYASPRQSGTTPVIFLARSFMGSENGEGVGITTLGLAIRWVKKR